MRLFLMCLFAFTLPLQAQSTAPFMYYYSEKEAAFIVERADGTERRILAEFTLPEYQWITGPGWSPSGEWFTWASGAFGNAILFSAQVVDRQGTNQYLISGDEPVLHLEWSSIHDHLMVVSGENGNNYRPILKIIDVESAQTLFTEQLDGFYGFAGTTYASWLPDGLHFAIYNATDTENAFRMRVFSVTGQLIGERLFFYPGSLDLYKTLPSWTPGGKVIYLSADGEYLIIEDFFTGAVTEMTFTRTPLAFVDWSPQEDFALIYSGSLFGSFTHTDTLTLWLYAYETHEISMLNANPQPNYSGDRGGMAAAFPSSTWRPDGQMAFFHDTEHLLYTIIPTQTLIQEITSPEISDWDIRHFNTVSWGDGGDLYFIANRFPDTVLMKYSPDTYAYDPIREGVSGFSMHAQQAAMTSCGDEWNSGCILDMETMHETMVQLGYPAYTNSPTGFLWHSSGEWAIMIGEAVNGYGLLGVTDSVAENYRTLEIYCRLNESCYGWLP